MGMSLSRHPRLSQVPVVLLLILSAIAIFPIAGIAPQVIPTIEIPTYIHVIVETFSVCIALFVFVVSWISLNGGTPLKIPALSCGFLVVALFDLMHLLSYPGMPTMVTPAGADKAMMFELSASISCAFTLVGVAFSPNIFLTKRIVNWAFFLWGVIYFVAASWLQLEYGSDLPKMVDPMGVPTPFHRACDVLVILAFVVAASRFYFSSDSEIKHFDVRDLFIATIAAALAEVCFLDSGRQDLVEINGLLLKTISYYYIFVSLFVTTIKAPYLKLDAEVEMRKEAEQRALRMAHHDALTGLPNRRLLEDRVTVALQSLSRHGHKILALVFIDIDDFKKVNDLHGHDMGDLYLLALADRMNRVIRRSDTLCRQGGDEFVILLNDLDEISQVLTVIKKLQSVMSSPITLSTLQLGVSMSIGIAMYPEDGENFITLFKNADKVMYIAKAAGKNTFCFIDSSSGESILGRDIEFSHAY